MPTEHQIKQGLNVLKLLADTVIEAVGAAGEQGAPGGHLYAALMATGLSLEQFERLMGLLVDAGKLTKRGQLYFKA